MDLKREVRRGSIPVSTVLWKTVRFYIIDKFFRAKTFQVARLFRRRMELANILNELETQERGLWGVKI